MSVNFYKESTLENININIFEGTSYNGIIKGTILVFSRAICIIDSQTYSNEGLQSVFLQIGGVGTERVCYQWAYSF